MTGVAALATAIRESAVWDDEDGPQHLPDSWTGQRHEPFEPGQRRFYAVLARVGEIKTIVESQRAVRVLYVRDDAARAFDRRYRAVEGVSGTVPDPESFRSSLVRPPRFGGEIPADERPEFAQLLEELYDIAVDDLEGDG